MKKRLIKGCALLFCATLVAIGCSKDEDSNPIEISRNLNLKSGGSIAEFTSAFNMLYGSNSYSVDKNAVKVVDRADEFFVYKVTIDSSTEGYILETPQDGNFYYEHDIVNKLVTEYSYDSAGKLNTSITDMSGNPYYNLHGFNPTLPPDPVLAPERFWGWVISYGPCGPNSSGDGGYSAQVFATHYVFWIGGEAKKVLQFSETRPNEKTNAKVDCINGVPGVYFGDIMTY